MDCDIQLESTTTTRNFRITTGRMIPKSRIKESRIRSMPTGFGCSQTCWKEMHLGGAWPAESGLTYGLVRGGGLISRINFVGVESMRWGGVRLGGKRQSTRTRCALEGTCSCGGWRKRWPTFCMSTTEISSPV